MLYVKFIWFRRKIITGFRSCWSHTNLSFLNTTSRSSSCHISIAYPSICLLLNEQEKMTTEHNANGISFMYSLNTHVNADAFAEAPSMKFKCKSSMILIDICSLFHITLNPTVKLHHVLVHVSVWLLWCSADELHNIVGAGAAEGNSLDAANIIKPALARGELRVSLVAIWLEFKDGSTGKLFGMLWQESDTILLTVHTF